MKNFCQSSCVAFVDNLPFSLIAFETFSLSSLFHSAPMMCWGVDLSLFIMLGTYGASAVLIWELISSFWKSFSWYFFWYFFSAIPSVLFFRNSFQIKLILLICLQHLLCLSDKFWWLLESYLWGEIMILLSVRVYLSLWKLGRQAWRFNPHFTLEQGSPSPRI